MLKNSVNYPLISVLISSYNTAAYIKAAINSILSQTYSNWELLIADDGSKDNTKEIINQYKDPRIKTYHNSENFGKIATCNKLLEFVRGDIITIHDADDWSEPERFVLAVEYFNKNQNWGALASYSRYVNHQNQKILRIRTPEFSQEQIKSEILKHNIFDGASLFVKKSVIDDIGFTRSFFNRTGGEDYDFICRIAEKYEIGIIPIILYNVNVTPNSFSRSIGPPEKQIIVEIIQYLHQQRLENGIDALFSNGNKKDLEDFIRLHIAPYKKDSSLLFRRAAASSFYNKLTKSAMRYSLAAIQKRPDKLINYRTLLYILRKSFLNLITQR